MALDTALSKRNPSREQRGNLNPAKSRPEPVPPNRARTTHLRHGSMRLVLGARLPHAGRRIPDRDATTSRRGHAQDHQDR